MLQNFVLLFLRIRDPISLKRRKTFINKQDTKVKISLVRKNSNFPDDQGTKVVSTVTDSPIHVLETEYVKKRKQVKKIKILIRMKRNQFRIRKGSILAY
jgi:hypothetical protein